MQKGTVKWFNTEPKATASSRRQTGEHDVSFIFAVQRAGLTSLKENQAVTFETRDQTAEERGGKSQARH